MDTNILITFIDFFGESIDPSCRKWEVHRTLHICSLLQGTHVVPAILFSVFCVDTNICVMIDTGKSNRFHWSTLRKVLRNGKVGHTRGGQCLRRTRQEGSSCVGKDFIRREEVGFVRSARGYPCQPWWHLHCVHARHRKDLYVEEKG